MKQKGNYCMAVIFMDIKDIIQLWAILNSVINMKYQYYDINNSLFVFDMYFYFMRSNVPAVVEAKNMTIYFVPIYHIINNII